MLSNTMQECHPAGVSCLGLHKVSLWLIAHLQTAGRAKHPKPCRLAMILEGIMGRLTGKSIYKLERSSLCSHVS